METNTLNLDQDEAPAYRRIEVQRLPHPETPAQRRQRYEAQAMNTGKARFDMEGNAVAAQPNWDESLSRASQAKAIHARCWQCVHAEDDGYGSAKISGCPNRQCALWSVRPYKPEGEVATPQLQPDQVQPGNFLERALSKPGARGVAIKGYCFDCTGGRRTPNVMREVSDCRSATCALWVVRPQAGDTAEPGEGPAEAAEAAADTPNPAETAAAADC